MEGTGGPSQRHSLIMLTPMSPGLSRDIGRGMAATVHGYMGQLGVHPGSLPNYFTSVEHSSCQEGSIDPPTAGRPEKSNSRFPCYG